MEGFITGGKGWRKKKNNKKTNEQRALFLEERFLCSCFFSLSSSSCFLFAGVGGGSGDGKLVRDVERGDKREIVREREAERAKRARKGGE